MLESLVASVLNRVLGSYVENFDTKQLQIGLLSGDVKLHGLKLKRGALDQLKLPINVVNGHIGSLVLQIPYSNLKSKPVKVFIEDVFLIAKPDMDFEEEGMKRRELLAKLEKLTLWELTSDRALKKTDEEVNVEQQNFTSSLVTKIIENLQITIRNIHVRFEDMDVGVAMGATLGELSALSTNSKWEPAFIANVDLKTHKLVTLDSLAFYIDPEVSTEFCNSEKSHAEMLEEFKAMIFDSIGATDILRPINGQGFITMSKKPSSLNEPKIKADLKFEELSVNLDREQYVDILRLTERFQNYFNNLKFRKNRPKTSIGEDPLAWFKYAATTVLNNVKERNSVWSWESIKRHIEDRKEYVKLYKKWYVAGGDSDFDAAEKEKFNAIEEKYSYANLVLFRSLAKQELVNDYGSLENARKSQQSNQTWGQWLWGSKPEQQNGSKQLEISDKERMELLSVLDEPNLVTQDAMDQVMLELDFSLRSAGIRLKAGDQSLASAGFDGVKATFINKPDSFSYEMGLKKFSVSDLTHSNQFSELITVQVDDNLDQEDFMWLLFEHHPADRVADSNLFLKSKSLQMVHNARLMDSVMKFFAVPPDQGETVDAILMAANKTVEELREQTRIGLEYALENHKTLNLQLDIKAPTIIIPLDPNDEDSAALVLEVGSLEMASDLVPLNVLQEVKSRQALKYTSQDWKRLESLMYDRFTIKLQDTQVLLGNKISELQVCRKRDSSNCHFLDRTTLQFLLEISIVPHNTSLTKSKLSIRLPSLRATLSDAQYLLFMKIIAAATPMGEVDPEVDDTDSKSIVDAPRENTPELLLGDEPKKDIVKSSNQPQRIFELLFEVNEVHFFIVKGWKSTPLVDMCLHDFKVKFWTSNNLPEEAMAVDVTIRDLLISDHVDPESKPELRKIAESVGHSDNSTSEYNLFAVEYRKTYSGDMTVNMNLEAIKFVLNPKSVLEVYDYVMSTFTQPNEDSENSVHEPPSLNKDTTNTSGQTNDSQSPNYPPVNQNSSKIDVTLNMRGVSALLVDNREPIATLAMQKTTINVTLVDEMQLQVILGSVSIKDSAQNDVMSIEEGADLADFRYETKPLDKEMRPTGPSLVYLRMGKVQLSVLEAPLTQLVGFLTKFTAMKSAYDQARMIAFNQAIQVEPSMFLFDVVISSPIIYWPCEDDWIRLDVGEVFFKNNFTGFVNDLKAGIHHVQVTSSIHGVEREIVPENKLDINVIYTPDEAGPKNTKDTPVLKVKSDLSPIHVRSSEHQYKLLMLFLTSLQRISEGTANAGLGEEEVGNLRRHLAKEKQITEQKASYWWGENFSLALGPPPSSPNSEQSVTRSSLNVEFRAPLFDIALELDNKPLTMLSIRDVAVDLNLNSETGTEIDFHVRSLSAEDLGNTKGNKFPQIIPPVKHDGYQIIGRIIQEQKKPLNVDCSIDSPQVIVAIEYMMRLKEFADYGLIVDEDEDVSDTESFSSTGAYSDDVFTDDDEYEHTQTFNNFPNNSQLSFGSAQRQGHNLHKELEKPNLTPIIKVDIVDMYLTVLADESDPKSEAIVFKIEQFIFQSNEAPTVEISKIGMYLMKMQLPEDQQLRILDDFNVTCWFDNSESTEQLRLSNARVRIDPLVLRISLREICLISDIASKASSIYSSSEEGSKATTNSTVKSSGATRRSSRAVSSKQKATNFFADDYRVATRNPSHLSVQSDENAFNQSQEQFEVTRILSEQLTVEIDGFRLVLIDPVHQLPLTDFCVKPFSLEARNWSDSLVAEAKAELYANVNSFAKSAWEPLIDMMEIGLTVNNESVTVYSEHTANFELTTETLELWYDIQKYFNNVNVENIHVSHRDDAAPYRIRNETGMSIAVWNESKRSEKTQERQIIKNGEEVKWNFRDWRELREDLIVNEQDYYIGVEFENEYYKPLQNILVNRIGEQVCVLRHDSIKERLVVDIWVDNHLKYVVIRSPYKVCNHTETELEIKAVVNNIIALPSYNVDSPDDIILSLKPHESVSLPLKHVDSRILVRRKGDTGWSESGIYWKDLISENGTTKKTFSCPNNFLLEAIPERPDTPMTSSYPYLSVHLSAPFQIINNLPRDAVVRLYCRTTRMESHFNMEKAGRALIHDYDDDSLLLLRVDIPGYKCNKFAVVNVGKRFNREFHIEDTIEVSQNNQYLRLHLEYVDLPEGNGRVIVIYSPYVFVNNTEHDLWVASHTNRVLCSANSACLWSFSRDKSHGSEKVTISTQDSHASHPVHIEASGTTSEVKVTSRDRKRDLFFGVGISPGCGRYVNSKIVTLSPRFIIYNTLDRPMMFHDVGGSADMIVESGGQASIDYIFTRSNKEMCMRFADSENAQWSQSFALSNVGTISVRASEKGRPTVLVRVEVLLEKSTLFIHLSAAKSWPYSIRNFTDQEFIFYQCDPFVDEDGERTSRLPSEFSPVTYRLPPRSAMPYSWDFPAASMKQLILEAAQPKALDPPAMPQRPPQLPNRSAASTSAASILSKSTVRSDARSRQVNYAQNTGSRTSVSSRRRDVRQVKYRKIQLAEIGELPPANFGNNSLVDLSVIADGPQLALVISPFNPESSHYDVHTNKVKTDAILEMEEADQKTGYKYNLELKGIGISCITPEFQELFYVTMHNLKVSYSVSDVMDTISTEVQWIQVDNSLPGASEFPVIVYPSVLPKAAEELAAHPCFSASLTRMRDDSYGVTYIKHATLLLQEMSIEVDEDFLLGLVKLVIAISQKTGPVGSKNRTYIPLLDDDTVLCEDDLHTPRPSGDSTPDIYFEQLHLQPIQLNLSFVRTGSLSTTDVFKDNTAAGSLAFIIDALTLTIGNVNVAPLRFNALLVDNVRTHLTNLMSMIQVHYQQEFMYQLHKVLGSADIIGNPVGLFNNISSGVVDLFYEPYLGYTLQERPSEFGVGLAKGGLSFMKKSVFGISDSISKVTGSLSKGLTAMTLDNRYQKQQRARRSRNRPKHLVYGLGYGLESFYESLSSGMMGLAEHPMQGALTDGTAGFFKGLGVGLIGLPTKASIGLLDLASNVTEGIRNTTTVFDVHSINRVRLPRVIAADGVIRPYNARESVGQMLLHSVRDGRYAKDHYLAHSNITKSKVVIVSLERVMVASINENTLEWSLSYSQIESVAVERSGIALTLRGGAHGPFIPLEDTNSRRYIYENIGKGVTQYQQKRIAFN